MNGQPQQQQQSEQQLQQNSVYLNGQSANNVSQSASASSSAAMVDLNNNQIQHSPHVQAAQYYTSLMSSAAGSTPTAGNSQANTNNLLANLNYANFLQLQQQSQQQQQQQQQQSGAQLDLFNNLAGLSSLLGTNSLSLSHAISGAHQPPPPPPPSSLQTAEELHQYDYMQKLLEEKEKLKELFNDPFNISLPISARLLDEGQ
jgi:hypothetical protein